MKLSTGNIHINVVWWRVSVLCSPDEVVDDDVRGPEELDHVGHHVNLAPAPVCAGVQEHPGH